MELVNHLIREVGLLPYIDTYTASGQDRRRGSPASGTAVLPVPGEGGRGTAGGAGPAADLMRQPDASGCPVLFLSPMIYNRFFR